MDESTTGSAPETATSKTQIVKAEWFWKSVQNEEQADEREYLFENVRNMETAIILNGHYIYFNVIYFTL